jgi:ATP synthase protein I
MIEEPNKDTRKKQVYGYVKYTGLFFQMLVIIGVFTFGGSKLDEYQKTTQPYFTAGFALLGVVIAIYQVLKGINQISNPNS